MRRLFLKLMAAVVCFFVSATLKAVVSISPVASMDPADDFFQRSCNMSVAVKNKLSIDQLNSVLISSTICKTLSAPQQGKYSFYGKGDKGFNNTAGFCGEIFHKEDMTIALPQGQVARPGEKPKGNQVACGTLVRLTDLHTKKSTYARVTDTGGFAKHGRIADVSYGVSRELGYQENTDPDKDPRLSIEFCRQ